MKKIVFSVFVLAAIACTDKKANSLGDSPLTALSFAEKKTDLINIASSDNQFFDADNDGDLDLFINGWTKEEKDFNTSARLYINDGEGNFTVSTESAFQGFEYGSVAIADIDGDQDSDIVFSGSFNGSISLGVESAYFTKVYKNNKGKFTEDKNQSLPANLGVINLSDINKDGFPDLIYTNEESFETYLNDGKGNFELFSNPNLKSVSEPRLVSADIDNDADNDLIVMGIVESVEPVVHIYLNNAGVFTAKAHQVAGLDQGLIKCGDIDGDKDMDLIISGIVSEEKMDTQVSSYIYKNTGKGDFESQSTKVPLYNLGQCLLSDLDNDNDLDLLFSGSRLFNEQQVSKDVTDLLLNDGKGNFTMYKENVLPGFKDFSMAFGDANKDGKTDVLVTCYALDPKYKDAPVELDEYDMPIEHNIPFTRLFLNTSK